MKLVSFDALRTLHFPPLTLLKPEQLLASRAVISESDWVLFPPYWLLNSLVFGLGARVFPSLPTYLIGHNKVEMTRVFEAVVPEHCPWTIILANTPENQNEIWSQMQLPFVAKIPKSSMGDGVFLIEEREQWQQYCARTDALYAQEFLPIDRDLRIVVLGEEILGGYWRIQSPYSFHNNVAKGGEIVPGPIPRSALELVQNLQTTLGIDHAGFDIAMVGDKPYVLEFNRLFGNQGLSAGPTLIAERIVDYLQAGIKSGDPTKPIRPKGGARRNARSRRAA